MPSIKFEADTLANLPGDLDNLRHRYLQKDTTLRINCEFPGFEITPLENNMYRLFSDCEYVPFDINWTMRPDYASYDAYGTVIYWNFILFANRIFSIEEFSGLSQILIPSIDSISEVISDKISSADYYIDLDEVPNTNESRYYRRYPMDMAEAERLEGIINEADVNNTTTSVTSTECELQEKIETFTLTAIDIANEYVELEYQPTNTSSITLNLNSYVTPQSYGYDYVLQYDSDGRYKTIISWDSDDCTLGSGMDSILEAGDILTITYIYSQIDCSDCPAYTDDILDGGVFGD